MSSVNEYLDAVRLHMACAVAVAALLFLTTIDAHASQYSCIDTGNGREVVVESSSNNEAERAAKRERKPSAGFYKCDTHKSVSTEAQHTTPSAPHSKKSKKNEAGNAARWHCDPRAYPNGYAGLPADCSGHIDLSPKSQSSQEPTTASASEGEQQPAQADPVNDIVTKGLGSLLKGFGK